METLAKGQKMREEKEKEKIREESREHGSISRGTCVVER
jgi:hypothetical protein